jgi:hypothetical protein
MATFSYLNRGQSCLVAFEQRKGIELSLDLGGMATGGHGSNFYCWRSPLDNTEHPSSVGIKPLLFLIPFPTPFPLLGSLLTSRDSIGSSAQFALAV